VIKEQEVGRLAMRQEGNYWNAYYALKNTMDGALLIGSIRIGAVINNRDRKQAFMEMMQDIVSDFLKDATGQHPTWNEPQLAPEHEKAGNA